MPEMGTWESFFDVRAVLDAVGPGEGAMNAVEFGCGYGTFTLDVARRIGGTLYALDMDAAVLDVARGRAREAGVRNIQFEQRDFIRDGSGLDEASVDYAMVFNILHHEDPVGLLRDARRDLRPGGAVGVIHWNHDADTPRGPPMEIRPRPEQCLVWAREAGLTAQPAIVDLPPWHYGFLALRAE